MPSGLFYYNFGQVHFLYKRCLVIFLLLSYYVEVSEVNANRVDTDQMLHSAASDLGLQCLPMSLVWDARLKCVKASFLFLGLWESLLYEFSPSIKIKFAFNFSYFYFMSLPFKSRTQILHFCMYFCLKIILFH